MRTQVEAQSQTASPCVSWDALLHEERSGLHVLAFVYGSDLLVYHNDSVPARSAWPSAAACLATVSPSNERLTLAHANIMLVPLDEVWALLTSVQPRAMKAGSNEGVKAPLPAPDLRLTTADETLTAVAYVPVPSSSCFLDGNT